jgi:hypothetical protein
MTELFLLSYRIVVNPICCDFNSSKKILLNLCPSKGLYLFL